MCTMITFSEDDSKNKISFSEMVNGNEMFVTGEMWSICYTKPFTFHTKFTEKEMRELRRHLTMQIRKLNKQ